MTINKFSFRSEEVKVAIAKAAAQLGYSSLKPKQQTALTYFFEGRDVFVNLPTGSGKSLCYFVLPLAFDCLRHCETSPKSIVLVVSPLIALMKDQVQTLQRKGVRGVYVGDADEATRSQIHNGEFQLVFMSPEAVLTNPEWRDMLQSPVYQENLVAFVVDEAQCVKKWGETFRREFLHLGEVRSLVDPEVRIMALTATATKTTRKCVCNTLGMKHPTVVTQSPNKQNIKYIVNTKAASLEEMFAPLVEELRLNRTSMDRVIIFGQSYDDCSRIYLFLKSRLGKQLTEPIGAPKLARFALCNMFSACTHPNVKEEVLKSFCDPNGLLKIVVATIAFGMGLDCPNVHRIIHWGPPSDIESYLQETGRAGRDGKKAVVTLHYSNLELASTTMTSEMKEYCRNKKECRRRLLLKDFDDCSVETETQTCQCCDVCSIQCQCTDCVIVSD